MSSVVSENPCRPLQHRPAGDACCVRINQPPDRPDLAIYSQEEQFARGAAPTWASPDIVTKNMSQDVKVTVRNLSPSASAVNGAVEFSTSDFGIGVKRTIVSTKPISVDPNEQTVLDFSSPSIIVSPPKAPQAHIGVHVRLQHPYDGRPINNNGSAMLAEALTSDAGRSFSLLFPVVNQAAAREITLSVLPNELGAVVTPASRLFAPLEQFMAALNVSVPDTFHGAQGAPLRKEVTVVGRGPDGDVIDGLTCVVWIDN